MLVASGNEKDSSTSMKVSTDRITKLDKFVGS